MVILLIISYINIKIFKIKIYKHQKCAILFNFSVLFIFELSTFILSMVSKNDEYIYTKYIWLIPIGLITYFLIEIAMSYTISKIKWFMDLNMISLSKLLTLIFPMKIIYIENHPFIDFFVTDLLINIIISVLFTFIKCGNNKNILCDKEEKGNYYIENFNIFFEKLLKM